MKKPFLFLLMTSFSFFIFANENITEIPDESQERVSAIEGLTAREILLQARGMFPYEKIELDGTMSVRKDRGFIDSMRPYSLKLDWDGTDPTAKVVIFEGKDNIKAGEGFGDKGRAIQSATLTRKGTQKAEIKLYDEKGELSEIDPRFNSRVGETDITWMDLTMDYLWWTDAEFKPEFDSRVSGRNCVALEAKPPMPIPGMTGMRMWVDKKLGFVLQTEHLGRDGKPIRRMWVQFVKKMEGRWMISDLEFETIGLNRRTSLKVENVKYEEKIVKE